MEKEKEKRVEGGTLNRGCISIYIGRAQSGKLGKKGGLLVLLLRVPGFRKTK
jgi:hypothetical protein